MRQRFSFEAPPSKLENREAILASQDETVEILDSAPRHRRRTELRLSDDSIGIFLAGAEAMLTRVINVSLGTRHRRVGK